MSVVGSTMHFLTSDHVDAGDPLFKDRRLARPKLGIRHRRH
jgi:hypothetical protein